MNQYLDLLAHFGIGGAHPGGFALTQSIFEKEKIEPHFSVLDIGCGTGQTASYLTKKFGCSVTAIDINSMMVEKAKKRFVNEGLNIKTVLGDVQKMKFADETFDFVLSESVISFTNIPETLKELVRVLKREGSMIIIEMTAEQPLSNEVREKILELYGVNQVLTEEEWITCLRQAGFTNVKEILTPPFLLPSEIDDIDESEKIPIHFYNLWDEHNDFVEKNNHLVGYRAFKCSLA